MNHLDNPGMSESEQTLSIDFETFQRGLPAGLYRVIVNPEKARKYMRHRLMLTLLTLPVIGTGVGMGLWGYTWTGLGLVVFGVLLNRGVGARAPHMLLHLASTDTRVYAEAIDFEILEVRAAAQDTPAA